VVWRLVASRQAADQLRLATSDCALAGRKTNEIVGGCRVSRVLSGSFKTIR
jgi:hypothetical protein